MLSKLTTFIAKAQLSSIAQKRSLLHLKPSSAAFSTQKQEEQEHNEKGRQTEADEEYQETGQEKATSMFRKVFRVGWWTFIGLFSYNYYLASNFENPEKETGYFGPVYSVSKAAQQKVQNITDFFTKPPVKKLLMDFPNIPGSVPPKTLVVNLTGTLIHTEFIFGKGTQIKKRPGLNQFLRRLSHLYEIVIFSDDDLFFIQEVIQNIDPNQMTFVGGFGKESMVYDGKLFKDLKYLNRDLKNVVVLDYNPDILRQYSSNGVFIDKFQGDKEDKLLIEQIPFLERLADHSIKDVREEIKKYGNTNPGKKFITEMVARKEAILQRQKNGMGSLFGGQGRQPANNFAKRDY